MKKIINTLLAASLLTILFTSCTKETKISEQPEISAATLAQIKSLRFSTQDVQIINGGYLVEGDIILTEAELTTPPNSPFMNIAQEEHYRTFNLVSATKYPTIKIALNNSSSKHQTAFSYALNEAIKRYNAQNLRVKFQRVTTGAHITVVAFYENSTTLGSAGFPTSTGVPYNQVRMNTYHYSTSTGSTNINYIATIMSHEVGHCIGFRHTDYMNRSYSCGGTTTNEGQATTGVGAVHIPGTPTGANSGSWMLACMSSGINRPFNTNDKTALAYVY
jgi:hypothetical protein